MARFKKTKKTGKIERQPDGHVRQSQMVGAYGPGSMVDLLHYAVVVGAIDDWHHQDNLEAIEEPRLRDRLADLYKLELASTNYFIRPPSGDDQEPHTKNGILVHEFPSWFVCQGCRRLVHRKDLEEPSKRDHRRRHDCERGEFKKPQPAVPVRFVGTCPAGHLQDFPWVAFAHCETQTCRAPELYLDEGRTGDFSEIRVGCATCAASQHLARMLIRDSSSGGFTCSGQRPWLRTANETCDEKLRLLIRTASNGYFAATISALSIPDPANQAYDEVSDVAGDFQGIPESAHLPMLQGDKYRPFVERFGSDTVLDCIARFGRGEYPERLPLRTAEYKKLTEAPVERTGEDYDGDHEHFVARSITVPPEHKDTLSRVVLAHRLREVRVQHGFTRLEPLSQNNQGEYDLGVRVAPIRARAQWLPATTIQGEGVFIAFSEDRLSEWANRPAVTERAEVLADGFDSWCDNNGRSRDDDKGPVFLGAKYYLLHSFSHLLMNAISLECGYSASAIRERIYCGPYGEDPTRMSGVLLYTGTPGSEGTLGGLVEQGRHIGAHVQRALHMATLCSNDPICAAHSPQNDPVERWLEGAACHGCLYSPEPSCERFNRYLDRALVVPVIGAPSELAYFDDPGIA